MSGMESPAQEASTTIDQPGTHSPLRYSSQRNSVSTAKRPMAISTSTAETSREQRRVRIIQ